MLLRMLVLLKILIRHSICDETKRINRNFSLFGNWRMLWPRFIDLQNFILLVRTVSFFRKIFFISSYTEKNNYFLLYELIQDLPYMTRAGAKSKSVHRKVSPPPIETIARILRGQNS